MRIPLLNFEGGPGVPFLNFEGVPDPGVLIPLLHHAKKPQKTTLVIKELLYNKKSIFLLLFQKGSFRNLHNYNRNKHIKQHNKTILLYNKIVQSSSHCQKETV